MIGEEELSMSDFGSKDVYPASGAPPRGPTATAPSGTILHMRKVPGHRQNSDRVGYVDYGVQNSDSCRECHCSLVQEQIHSKTNFQASTQNSWGERFNLGTPPTGGSELLAPTSKTLSASQQPPARIEGSWSQRCSLPDTSTISKGYGTGETPRTRRWPRIGFPKSGYKRLFFIQLFLLILLAVAIQAGQSLHIWQLKKLKHRNFTRLQQNTSDYIYRTYFPSVGINNDTVGMQLPRSLPEGVRVFYKLSERVPTDFISGDSEPSFLLCAEPPVNLFFQALRTAGQFTFHHIMAQLGSGEPVLQSMPDSVPSLEAKLLNRMSRHLTSSLLPDRGEHPVVNMDPAFKNSPIMKFFSLEERDNGRGANDVCSTKHAHYGTGFSEAVSKCAFLAFFRVSFWIALIFAPMNFLKAYRCAFEVLSRQYYLTTYGNSLAAVTSGALPTLQSHHESIWTSNSHAYSSVPLLEKLNVYFQRGGFSSPCYPLLHCSQKVLTSNLGLISYLMLFVGWLLNSLYSIHPVTIVHAPRMFLYSALIIYRCIVLYIMGNFVEYYVLNSAHDFSDHIVLYILYLLIISIEVLTLQNNCNAEFHATFSCRENNQSGGRRKAALSTNWVVYGILSIYYFALIIVLLYLAFYTSWFSHKAVEVWTGFFVGVFGLIFLFWILLYTGALTLNCTGFADMGTPQSTSTISGPTALTAAHSLGRIGGTLSVYATGALLNFGRNTVAGFFAPKGRKTSNRIVVSEDLHSETRIVSPNKPN